MKSKEEQPDDVPKSKSAFRFFAGFGIGIVFGWLGTFFRRTPRPVEQISKRMMLSTKQSLQPSLPSQLVLLHRR